jgi:hypothetical protein
VKICKTGPVLGYVDIPDAPLISGVVDDPDALPPWPVVVRDTERRVMTLLAGALAEAKLLGAKLRSHCCESDLGRSQLLCGVLAEYRDYLVDERGQALPPVDAAAMANALRSKAARVLARPNVWHAVAVLAADLEGWGSLSGHDAADTVQWARRVRRQLALRLPMPKLRRQPMPQPMGLSADSTVSRSGSKSRHESTPAARRAVDTASCAAARVAARSRGGCRRGSEDLSGFGVRHEGVEDPRRRSA